MTGAARRDGNAYLRVEGLERQLIYRRDRLLALLAEHRPDVLDDRQTVTLWRDLRDLSHFTDRALPLWRIPDQTDRGSRRSVTGCGNWAAHPRWIGAAG